MSFPGGFITLEAYLAFVSFKDSVEHVYVLGGSDGKRLPALQETRVRPGWEAPLEKEMATHSSVLAWRIPGTGEPGGLRSMGSHRVGHD